MDRALIVKKPWIDLILSGEKTWEMRSRTTNIRGEIGLIESGSGLIVGSCEIADCFDAAYVPIDENHFNETKHLHRIESYEKAGKWLCPWKLENAIRFDEPIPYKHPQGAVTWVKLKT